MDCRLHTFDSTFGSITIVRFRMFDMLAVQPRDYPFWYIIFRLLRCTEEDEINKKPLIQDTS